MVEGKKNELELAIIARHPLTTPVRKYPTLYTQSLRIRVNGKIMSDGIDELS